MFIYVTDLIKKLDYIYWLLLFLIMIKLGHAKTSVSKIGIPMSKTACINPWKKITSKIYPKSKTVTKSY